MPPHPSATPGKQVGGCRGGGRRAGRAGRRRGASAPDGDPRGSSSGRRPSYLTGGYKRAKIIHEGSHRQHSQRCLAHGATKSPVVSRRPGFCCIRYPAPAALAASNAPNATKPLLFCCVHQTQTKIPLCRYVNANKKAVLLRFAPVESSRLYSKWDTLPSLRSGWDDRTMPQLHPSTQHHATARAIECDAAIFLPASDISPQAAPQPSRKSSPRTCCYGSSPSARARYLHIAAAARPRTPSGSYAARHSAAAGTPSPRVSRRARRPVLSGASGNPGPETPTQYHPTPNASPKSTCPSDSHAAAFPSSSPRSKTAARSAADAAPKRR